MLRFIPNRQSLMCIGLWGVLCAGVFVEGCAKGEGSGVDSGPDSGPDSDTSRDSVASTDTVRSSDSETPFDTENMFTVSFQRADEIDPNAPGTIFIVTWSTRLPAVERAVIRFGVGGTLDMNAPVDLKAPEYRTVLLGMRPAETYAFQIVADFEGTAYESETYEIETGPATNLVTISSFEVDDEAARGFIVAAVGETAVIIGPEGDVVWWYRSTVAELVSARMSYDGKSMWLLPRLADPMRIETGPLERVTMDTFEVQIYDNVMSSHDLTPVSGETMAFVNRGSAATCEDTLIEIINRGDMREVFRMSDYIEDCHVNAVRYNEAENLYTVSDRSSTIFGVGRDGEVRWQLSDTVPNTVYGGIQHGHHLLEDTLLLFANHASAASSVVYEFNRADGTVVDTFDGGEYSNTFGSTQRLPNGNTMIVYSNAGSIREMDPQGVPVMSLQTDPIGYATWQEDLYGPPSDVKTY